MTSGLIAMEGPCYEGVRNSSFRSEWNGEMTNFGRPDAGNLKGKSDEGYGKETLLVYIHYAKLSGIPLLTENVLVIGDVL